MKSGRVTWVGSLCLHRLRAPLRPLRPLALHRASFVVTRVTLPRFLSGKLSTDGHWGSDLELQALAEIYQVSFTVHANMRASVNIAPQREDQRRRTTRAALWFAHGNHYNALYTMAEFERRGFHRSNRELEEYLEDRRANEEKSAQLTRELSEEPDEPPQQPLELSHSTLQDLRDAGIDEVELAQHISAATISAPTAAESARIQPRTLTDEQRRQPTVALLLAQGFTEAELAQNLNAAEHLREPRTAPGALSLPPELLRRQTVLGLLQAGVSEEEIRKQWFQPS